MAMAFGALVTDHRGLAPPGVTLAAGGMVAGSWSVAVAEECGEAVRGAEAVVIAVDGRGLRATIDALAPHLGFGQACIISAHLSFAALISPASSPNAA